eukprot:PLAT12149.1.p1 GENE.PLAT12149.1~~PLAT12149.1.p1  ORF type:complete len:201 (-),score=45.53 PLAT12149.1:150-752(-)
MSAFGCCPSRLRRQGDRLELYRCSKTAKQWPRVWWLGPHYPCTIVTFGLVIGGSGAMIAPFDPSAAPAAFGVGVVLLLATLQALAATAFSDPGVVHMEPGDEEELLEEGALDDRPVCNVCGIIRMRGVVHCSECGVCIEGYDHHCPWMGQCIGKNNLSSFYRFICLVFTLILYLAFAGVAAAAATAPRGHDVHTSGGGST